MRKRVTAAVLILVSIFLLAACTVTGSTDESGDAREENNRSYSEEKIYGVIDKICVAIASCDGESLKQYCNVAPYGIINDMPVVMEFDENNYHVTDNMLLVRNMIASTIEYEIDESSYKASIFDKKYTVDVTLSWKDYSKIIDKRDVFLGAADFNMLMAEEESRILKTYTLQFVKKDNHYLLANPSVLAGIYDYDLPELEFMKNYFDMIEDSYMSGPGWDSYTECYYDTNTFEFDIVLDWRAPNYVWQYIYVVAKKNGSDWDTIYNSGTVMDKYPTKITLTYSQEENFEEGHYYFIIYDVQSENIYGWEYDVFNSKQTETTKPV